MNKDSGKVVFIGEITSGSTKDGKDWRKQDLVIEWGNKFKERLCATFFNDKVEQLSNLNVGDAVTLEYTSTSRSWASPTGEVKWFHNINGQKVDLDLDAGNESFKANGHGVPPSSEEDDLPF